MSTLTRYAVFAAAAFLGVVIHWLVTWRDEARRNPGIGLMAVICKSKPDTLLSLALTAAGLLIANETATLNITSALTAGIACDSLADRLTGKAST